MGKRILLDVSPTGIEHHVEVDENGFTYAEHSPDHVEKMILDECAAARSLHQNSKSNFKLAARVPLVLHTMWKKEWREKYRDTYTWQTFLAMKLNSRDFENLRTGHKDGHTGMKL